MLRRLSRGLSLNPQKSQFLMNQGRLLGHFAVKDYEGTREGDLGNDDACECERSQILPGTRYNLVLEMIFLCILDLLVIE